MLGGRITSNDKDRGAAFAITARLVVTANHVVRGQEVAFLRFVEDSGQKIEIDRVEGEEELDIALLHLRADASDVLPLGEAADGFNWRVEMQPHGNDPWLTGSITAARRKFTNQRKYETQVVQLHVNELLGEYAGYSGSPVLLDAYPSFVVGVLVEEFRLRLQPTNRPSRPRKQRALRHPGTEHHQAVWTRAVTAQRVSPLVLSRILRSCPT